VIREDNVVKDLLFAGTELGVYISRNGGKNWTPFQLNLPLTPITDLRVHQNNLIASTSGRSFWILDDLNLIRQFKTDTMNVNLYQPSSTTISNGYSFSELNYNNSEFKGAKSSGGVNPATGMVLYYQLPIIADSVELKLTIKNAKGKLIRSFSSKEGGKKPTLSKTKGLNRFVWDLRHETTSSIPNVFIESSFSGHTAIPGTYSIHLMVGDKEYKTNAALLSSPDLTTNVNEHALYDSVMSHMESTVTEMHDMVNELKNKSGILEDLIKKLKTDATYKDPKYAGLLKNAQDLLSSLTSWDEDMIQRKSTSYDDVENFPNKFTANYMFLMNQTENDVFQVNQPSLDLLKTYTAEWQKLKARGLNLKNEQIPAFNKQLWDIGMGVIW
jgi:hypothetical protein